MTNQKIKPNWQFEAELIKTYGGHVAGVDEAGRGPLAGPVVAAAVMIEKQNLPAGLNDSKKLSEAKREDLYHLIHEVGFVGIGVISPEEIDKINILQATLKAMKQAVEALGKRPSAVLIDGNKTPDLAMPSKAIIKGDQRSLLIAASSIIAKVHRDHIMIKLDQSYPAFGFKAHKGYGTKKHLEALKAHGPCPAHRRSFKPVANAC